MDLFYNGNTSSSPVKGDARNDSQQHWRQQQQQSSPQSVVMESTNKAHAAPSSAFSFDPYSPHSSKQVSMPGGTSFVDSRNQYPMHITQQVQPQLQLQPTTNQQLICKQQLQTPAFPTATTSATTTTIQQQYQQQTSFQISSQYYNNRYNNDNDNNSNNINSYNQFQPPSVQVNSDFNFSSHSVSPQTTPTNQPITTTTPNAPKKGPRTNNIHESLATNDIDDPFGLNRPRRRVRSISITSSRSSTSNVSNMSTYSTSIIDDPTFAPPPTYPKNLTLIKDRYYAHGNHEQEVKSSLPSFDLVKHSGETMGRFSMKSMIMKKWKQVYWISYGYNQLLIFRSKMDFEEWISNPFLTKNERNKLVKLNIDFVNDLYKPMMKGYSVTSLRKKDYGKNGLLHHFKLEKWMDYGPSVIGAFASKNHNDVYSLRRLMREMIELSPQKYKKQQDMDYGEDTGSSAYDSDAKSARSMISNKSHISNISIKSAPSSISPFVFNNQFTSSQQTHYVDSLVDTRAYYTRSNSLYQPLNIDSNGFNDEVRESSRVRKMKMFKRNHNSNKGKSEYNESGVMTGNAHQRRAKSAEPTKVRGRGRFGKFSRQQKPNDKDDLSPWYRVREAEVDYAL